MTVAVVSCGVTPLDTEILGDTVPLYRNPAVLTVDRLTEKCVTVSDPPVAWGKEIVVDGLTVEPEMVHPVLDLSTATRSYDV